MEFDVLIRNGSVFDGLGGAPVNTDIGIRGDRIEAVGDLARATGKVHVDAAGMTVAPGFIDTHTHSDMACFLGEEHAQVAAGDVRQGVTTEVCGNCGYSPFPHLANRRPDIERHMEVLRGPAPIRWHDLAGYADAVRQAGTYANLAPLIGNGSIRAGVIGFDNRPTNDDELRTMIALVEQALEQGAFGLSSGLIYTPGMFDSTDQLVKLANPAARYGRPYISHIRGETDMVADSVREAIQIGQTAGTPVHISHHKASGKQNWGRTEETLGLVQAARESGTDVTLDVYPYTAGSTFLHAVLPPWVQEGGVPKMLERLEDDDVRRRIRRDFESGLPGWENLQRAAGWDGIYISSCPGDPVAEGKSILELSNAAGQEESDYVFDLLIDQGARVIMIMHVMSEDDVVRVLKYETTMIGSDGIPLPGKPHPRWTGSFSRILGRYCREERVLDLATAIKKMTSLPAERFGLDDRGTLAKNKFADLVVFDADKVVDRATFEDPFLAPDGVQDVYVNGQAVVRNGSLIGVKPGMVLAAT